MKLPILFIDMGTTQEKGDIAKAKAISTFTNLGYYVAILLTESASYDLIVEKNGICKRVQVKYSGGKKSEFRMRKIHSNSKGYVIKFQTENEYDWAYILDVSGNEYLLLKKPNGKNSYKLRKTDLIQEVCHSNTEL